MAMSLATGARLDQMEQLDRCRESDCCSAAERAALDATVPFMPAGPR
jgi:hypothetical protein